MSQETKNTKSYGVRTTVAAHERIGRISSDWGVSQGTVMSIIFENISDAELDRLQQIAEEMKNRIGVRVKPTTAQIRDYLLSMTPEERRAFLEAV